MNYRAWSNHQRKRDGHLGVVSISSSTAVLFNISFLNVCFQLQLECRQNIINRALKYSRQQGGGKAKFVLEKDATFMQDDATAKFLQFQKHLESLQDEDALVLKDHDQVCTCTYNIHHSGIHTQQTHTAMC